MKNFKFLLMSPIFCIGFARIFSRIEALKIINNTPTQMALFYEGSPNKSRIVSKRGIQWENGKYIILPYSEGELSPESLQGGVRWEPKNVRAVYGKKEGGEVSLKIGRWDSLGCHTWECKAYIVIELRKCKNGKDKDKYGNYCYRVKPDVSREDYYHDLAGNKKIQETLRNLEQAAIIKKKVVIEF